MGSVLTPRFDNFLKVVKSDFPKKNSADKEVNGIDTKPKSEFVM